MSNVTRSFQRFPKFPQYFYGRCTKVSTGLSALALQRNSTYKCLYTYLQKRKSAVIEVDRWRQEHNPTFNKSLSPKFDQEFIDLRKEYLFTRILHSIHAKRVWNKLRSKDRCANEAQELGYEDYDVTVPLQFYIILKPFTVLKTIHNICKA